MTEQRHSHWYRNLFIGTACGVVLLYLCFAIYYTRHTRAELLADFLGTDGCVYRLQKFASQMFTDDLKRQGNTWSLAAVPLAALFCLAVYRMKLSLRFPGVYLSFKKNVAWLLALLALCIALGVYGCSFNALCTDEAFSALNFAERPMHQLLSYYPLPNNHVFFNLLNHVAAGIGGDAFLSGRALSVVSYCLMSCANFLLFYHFTKNGFLSFLCSALLALQFIVWGFGHQARGYALCYLLQWGGFFAFYTYFFGGKEDKNSKLGLLLSCNIIGIWTVPVYLYLVMFQCCSAVLLMVWHRRMYLSFWYTICLSAAGVCLVYLPLFCYSGFGSIFGGYDTGLPFSELWHQACFYFYHVVSLQTFNFLDLLKTIASLLFLAPFVLCLVFRERLKKFWGLLFLYATLWVSLLLMCLEMRHMPIMRGIGFYMQYSLLLLLLMLASLVQQSRTKRVFTVAFAGMAVLCGVRMFNYNREFSPADLYGQDTRSFFNALQALPQDFPAGSRIWLPDECFMWPYILKDRSQTDLYDCSFRSQGIIFLSEDDKPLPEQVMQQYHLHAEAGWFKIYERNK